MKKLLFLLTIVIQAIPLYGQNTMTIRQKDGQQFSFGFEEKPVVTYTDSILILRTINTEVQYPLSSVATLTFSDVENAVIPIRESINTPVVVLDSYVVSISGSSPDKTVYVVGSDGNNLISVKTDSEGSVSFSIAGLPEGIYIIKSNNVFCKILKK